MVSVVRIYSGFYYGFEVPGFEEMSPLTDYMQVFAGIVFCLVFRFYIIF